MQIFMMQQEVSAAGIPMATMFLESSTGQARIFTTMSIYILMFILVALLVLAKARLQHV